jgi:acetylornithine deacetylase/succinyl-diaminopimelate desuccinylase-like protein
LNAHAVARRAAADLDRTLADLCEYLRIPAISAKPAHAADVARLADRVAADMAALGLEAQVHALPDALPLVAASWMGAGPDRPTLLVYGHLDLQPADEPEWTTSPHDPVVRDGRLHARGASDDMGGWVSHLAAIRAWLAETGGLPCNLRLVVEGEEEIGSPNLERYMDAFPEAFSADVMILTDCENPATDVPGLTVSLRGLFEIDVRVDALQADVHSGLWGNMAPDVSWALLRLLARLVDEHGRCVLGRQELDSATRAALGRVAIDVRAGAHLLDGVAPLPLDGRSAAEWLWRQPAVTVVATTLPQPELKKNALRRGASAILSVRVPPGRAWQDLYDEIRQALLRDPPQGVRVDVGVRGTPGESWLYTPRGPAFPAADRAYLATWGHRLVPIGIGGSIPFVALFGRRYGDLPLILNGVMDPASTAHGPNESLDLALFGRAVGANVHLYAELGALPRPV